MWEKEYSKKPIYKNLNIQGQGAVGSYLMIMTRYNVKSVQSTLSHLISTSVPRTTFTRFLVEHQLFQYYS